MKNLDLRANNDESSLIKGSNIKRPSKENAFNFSNNNKLKYIPDETPESSIFFNSIEMNSWRDESHLLNQRDVPNLVLETKTKCAGLIFVDQINKLLLNEMKLHFKLLLKSPFPEDFYKRIESKELKVLIGLDKETKDPAVFTVLDDKGINFNNYICPINTKICNCNIKLKTNEKVLIKKDEIRNSESNCSNNEDNNILNTKKCEVSLQENNNKNQNNCTLHKERKMSLTILAFAVIKEYQRQGVGSMIMEKIIKDAEAVNINSIDLIVQSSNLPAICFYKKHGFRTSKIMNNYYNFEEEEENRALLMVRKNNIIKANYLSDFFSKIKQILLCRNSVNIENEDDDTTDDEK